MPPCRLRNVKLVAEAELPILPFLAPRVFQPWPQSHQPSRAYSRLARGCLAHACQPSHQEPRIETCSATPPCDSPRVQPWTQSRCYSAHKASGSRSRQKPAHESERISKITTSRSKIAQDWYESAFALDEQQPAHDQTPEQNSGGGGDAQCVPPEGGLSTTKQPGAKSQQRPSARGSQTPSEKHREWQRTNARRRQLRSHAWTRARWTAHLAAKEEPVRTKWVRVGTPVKLRKQPDTSSPDPQKSTDGEQIEEQDATKANDVPEDALGYAIPEHVFRWHTCFARLQAKTNRRRGDLQVQDQPLKLDPKAAEYASHILDQASSSSGIDVQQIERHFGLGWHEIWLHAALSLLDSAPTQASRFLAVTHIDPYPPAAWVSDCLYFLAGHHARAGSAISQAEFDQLVDVFCTVMDRPAAHPLTMNNGAIRLLLHRCTTEQGLRIFDSITRHHVEVHWNTLLHLATFLAQRDCFEQALDALLEAAAAGADTQADQFLSTCATILRKAGAQVDGLRVSLRIIQNLAELGVKLNVQHCNIAMLNAVESGDLKSAFSVYHSLVDHGLQADKYTHAILLKGCKSEIQDSETLNSTIREALRDLDVTKSPVVASEILHCLYLHHFDRNPDTAFSTIAEAFTQLFDATALIRMKILPADCQDPSIQARLGRPTLAVYGIMLSAYLRDRSARNSASVARHDYQLHKHIRTLSERAVQPWASLAETDYLANAFLIAFTAHPSSLAYAAEVIRDMQTPLPAMPDCPNPAAHKERPVCKPTVQSWSIFLNGFAKHKKLDLAEQVLQYMREKGMRPNQVTWNSLLAGYVGAGDPDGALEAFKRMQEDGFHGNDVTYASMSRLGVDTGMQSQGEEVRDALSDRIRRLDLSSPQEGDASNPQETSLQDDFPLDSAVADEDPGAGQFWYDSESDIALGDEHETPSVQVAHA